MRIGQAETSLSFITIEDTGVVFWRYKEGAKVSLDEAQEEVKAVGKLVDDLLGGKSKLLIDIRQIGSIDRPARRLFASNEVSNTYGVQCLALILGSPVSTLIGNFWQAINPPKHPTKLFTDEQLAIDWLMDHDQ